MRTQEWAIAREIFMRVEQSEQELEAQVDRDLRRGNIKGLAALTLIGVALAGFIFGIGFTAEVISHFVAVAMGVEQPDVNP